MACVFKFQLLVAAVGTLVVTGGCGQRRLDKFTVDTMMEFVGYPGQDILNPRGACTKSENETTCLLAFKPRPQLRFTYLDRYRKVDCTDDIKELFSELKLLGPESATEAKLDCSRAVLPKGQRTLIVLNDKTGDYGFHATGIVE
jgi:hypothetical protein